MGCRQNRRRGRRRYLGIRTGKTVLKRTPTPQVTRTHYLVDKNAPLAQVVAETDESGTVKVKYVHGDDLISQTRDPNGPSPITSYYHYDGQMSTRHLTNDPADPQTTSAQVTDSYTYEAFGALWAHTGETPNDFLYTGQQLDPNTGFYYLRARYYNPAAGRFVTRDTFDGLKYDPITLHKYVYAASQPLTYQDPNGAFPSLLGTVGVISILLIVMSFPNVVNAPSIWDTTQPDASGEMVIGLGVSLILGLVVLGIGGLISRADRLFAGRNPSVLRSGNMRASRTDVRP